MANTDTSYLGLRLPHPFIAGASPFGYQLDAVRRLEDAGAAAVVLHSLFEEQITMMSDGRVAGVDPLDKGFSDVIAEFPEADEYSLTPEGYAEHIHRLKKAVRIPIIASLNGASPEAGCVSHASSSRRVRTRWSSPVEVVTHLGVPATAIERRLTDIVRDLKGILAFPSPPSSRRSSPPSPTSRGNSTRRAPTASSSSTASTSRISTSGGWKWCQHWTCRPAPSCACASGGSPSCTDESGHRWRSPAASPRPTTGSKQSSRGRTSSSSCRRSSFADRCTSPRCGRGWNAGWTGTRRVRSPRCAAAAACSTHAIRGHSSARSTSAPCTAGRDELDSVFFRLKPEATNTQLLWLPPSGGRTRRRRCATGSKRSRDRHRAVPFRWRWDPLAPRLPATPVAEPFQFDANGWGLVPSCLTRWWPRCCSRSRFVPGPLLRHPKHPGRVTRCNCRAWCSCNARHLAGVEGVAASEWRSRPRAHRREGTDRMTMPVAVPVILSEQPRDPATPAAPLVLDARPLANGTDFLFGLPEAPASSALPGGPGSGGGVGSGTGTGLGSGTGPGIGSGLGGGFGGGVYHLGSGVVASTLLKESGRTTPPTPCARGFRGPLPS